MNILFVGDIFGGAGRRIVHEHLGHVRTTHNVDLTVINSENAAGGFGVTPPIAEEIFDWGADVQTTGNHVWDKKELLDYLKSAGPDSMERPRRVLRPANFAPRFAGIRRVRRRDRGRRGLRRDQPAGARVHGLDRRPFPRCRRSAEAD